ncbi:unnamed protein product [Rotaria magnacalcarata]|uniref:Tubulin-specific chaperone D n=1 Tax=Rotaria magnacalcarata TaxID=392030 RepID=A0A816NMZ9_9BILA|nr:unnamed protein product [Rotaria magnacalcarata]
MTADAVDIYDHDPVYFSLNEFEQHEQVKQLIEQIGSIDNQSVETVNTNEQTDVELIYDQFQYILNQYQEQPQLLDSYLPDMILRLLNYIEHGPNKNHIAGALLHQIIKVRGFKVMTTRFLPHEPHHLIVVIKLIDRELEENSSSENAWATLYSLLVWLGTTCMVPLDLCRFDSKSSKQTTMVQILNIYKRFLCNSVYMRMVAFNIGHFMSRQDSIRLLCLNDYLTGEIFPILEKYDDKLNDENIILRITASLQTVSYIFKFGQRLNLIAYVESLYNVLIDKKILNAKRIVIRRMAYKLLQKLAMILLPMPKHGAAWRYRRGVRNLLDSLTLKKNTSTATTTTTTTTTIKSSSTLNGHKHETNQDGENDDAEDNSNVPSTVESIIDLLMAGLSDKELYVRWSSAKGLGRITNRLRKSYAAQLVSHLCDRISTVALLSCDHYALQGGCLALAELARRGLLLPERLGSVMPIVHKSLNYDEKLGHQTYGHIVRDAACYVCWSFARAFDTIDFRSYTADLAGMLLCIICFDWNVQCRRAASAALQENVGRQGEYFPHGIDIIQQTDYNLIGKFDYCFLTLAFALIKYYDIYGKYMIEHLLKYKIIHWKKETRLLTSQLLEKTSSTYGTIEEIYETILLPVLDRCLDKKNDGIARHGLLASCGHIVYGLYQRFQKNPNECQRLPELRENLQNKISNLLNEYRLQGYLEGYSGDLIRPSLCSFIENISRSIDYFRQNKDDMCLSNETIDCWQTIIDECISNLDDDVRQVGLNALKAFSNAFYSNSTSSHLIDRYLGKISITSQEHIRQGLSLAVASLPSQMLLGSKTIDKILDCLFKLITITNQSQHLIKQRKDSLIALCDLYENTHLHSSSPFSNQTLVNKLINSFLRCTRDYTNDRFGDSGRLVREKACSQIVRLLQLINENSQTKNFLTLTILQNCFCAILTNLCSKIDDLRMNSGESVIKFLNIPFGEKIEHKNELNTIFLNQNDIDWRNSQIAFTMIVQLLIYDKYRYVIWSNCLITAGDLSNASQALYTFLKTNKSNDYLINLLLNDLEKIFSDQRIQMRVVIPSIQACERLLSQSTFENYYEKHSKQLIQHWTNIIQSLEDILTKKLQTLNNNPTLYLHFIKLYCSLLQFNNIELKNLVLKLLTKFFLHNYPWVRRQAAQNLYDTCILFNDDLLLGDDEDKSEQVMNLLTETDWEQNLDELTKIRQTLLNLFHIE